MIATFKTPDFVSNLKAALLAASTDITRANLNCVRIELAAGVARFVATNGHWMWLNESHYSEVVGVDEKGKKLLGDSSAIVHIGLTDARAILKNIEKGKKAQSWDVEVDTSGNVSQLGKTVLFAPKAVAFPAYATVLPAAVPSSPGSKMTYDPTYIADVTAAFAEVSSTDSAFGICFEPSGGELDPVVVTSDTSSALALLMPRRLSRKPEGQALLAKYRGKKQSKAA